MQPSPKHMPENLSDTFTLAGKTFHSRLLVGSGKYASLSVAEAAIRASGAEIITVAVRRINLSRPGEPTIYDVCSPKEFTYLPNTAGCKTADEAVRTLRLAREASDNALCKLEVIGDDKTLYPDMLETLRATELLAKEGFQVMAYTTDDPVMTKRVENAGAIAIMPLGAPIGSGLGIQNPLNIQLIVKQSRVPVLVDAGVGTASDATIAMELGCDGVLMNTAIAESSNPVMMASAMKLAIESGRLAYRAGRMPKKYSASPSSPSKGLL